MHIALITTIMFDNIGLPLEQFTSIKTKPYVIACKDDRSAAPKKKAKKKKKKKKKKRKLI